MPTVCSLAQPEISPRLLKQREYDRTYRLKYYDEIKERHKRWMQKYRLQNKVQALLVIVEGKPLECTRCGLTDVRLLEANHRNHDGSQEFRKFGSYTFYKRIIQGKRAIQDLNVMCKLCNWADFIEHKFGVKYEVNSVG